MAEILFGLAAETLKSLGSLDIEEIVSIYGLADEIDKLSDIASSIQAILIDAEEQQGSSNLVRNWIKRLKKVFFEADDLLDDVITEVKHRKLFHKAIRRDLDMIAKDKATLNLVERRQPLLLEPYSVQLNLDRETYSFVCDGEVIERSDDKKKIADFLLDSKVEENVVVISIVEKIVKSGGGKKDNYLQLDAVQNELRKMLNGKKYLLVLDDVWNEDPLKWSRLKNMLIGVAKGSKILLTTHSDVVAEVSGSVHQHKLGDLSEEKTWTLFEKMAFGCNKESENSNLVEIGKEIVRKCGAVPLAISITKTEDTEVVPEQTLYASCLFQIDGSLAFPNSFFRKHMKLRSFIFLNDHSSINVLSNSTLERMISSFSRLQALHLGNLDIEFLPQSLGGLKHLRYLSVSSESIVTLPNSITKLHNQQVLKLDDCRELKNLPRDIWRSEPSTFGMLRVSLINPYSTRNLAVDKSHAFRFWWLLIPGRYASWNWSIDVSTDIDKFYIGQRKLHIWLGK
ncbi:putative oxidation resistance protein 1-like isoform X1 [Capsicum annuum]|nr:putative oxidation resistance protein 1-like isoform X1 [Capsicum annuum]